MKSKSTFILKIVTVLSLLVLSSCNKPTLDTDNPELSSASHLAEILKRVKKDGKPFDLSIKPTTTGLITTCKGDEPAICDILASACEELGGVGQCGGDENPTGCQCET